MEKYYNLCLNNMLLYSLSEINLSPIIQAWVPILNPWQNSVLVCSLLCSFGQFPYLSISSAKIKQGICISWPCLSQVVTPAEISFSAV